MKLGIFGGSFNPIHLGHLILAEAARDALKLDRVLFVPTGQPPHKSDRELLPGAVRLKLIQLAIRDHTAFAASDIELRRSGPSYSIETVKLLRRQVPNATLYLIVGEDMLTVPWRGWAELKRLCTIVAARRPGMRARRSFDSSRRGRDSLRITPHRLGRGASQPGIEWVTMPQVDIASSDIRRRVQAGRSIRYLVPAAVARAIAQQHLYRR